MYPFSFKPDKLLSRNDLFKYHRDSFEGTPFDLTKGTNIIYFIIISCLLLFILLLLLLV